MALKCSGAFKSLNSDQITSWGRNWEHTRLNCPRERPSPTQACRAAFCRYRISGD